MEKQLTKFKGIYAEYPKTFWTLVIVTFIDKLGGFLLFPFFALYITRKFDVGMTEVGILFALFAGSSFIGSFLGGALTDRIGRRSMIIFSLLTSAFSTLAMGFVDSLQAFYIIAMVSGIFTDTGGPAYNAIVGDLLPEEKRAQGFGVLRVALNVSAVIGPAIGGFLAARSYLALFVIDAIISTIVAIIVYFTIPETKPELQPGVKPESMGQSFRGYFRVFGDGAFLLFILASTLAWMTYMNMNTTLGVFLRDVHGIPEAGYGYIISLNAIIVVSCSSSGPRAAWKNTRHAGHGIGDAALCSRFRHVRLVFQLYLVHAGHGRHHGRRNDCHPSFQCPGDQLCPRGHARSLWRSLWHLLDAPVCRRSLPGRLAAGQLQPEPAVVRLRRVRDAGNPGFYDPAPHSHTRTI
jgi:MFS family permease